MHGQTNPAAVPIHKEAPIKGHGQLNKTNDHTIEVVITKIVLKTTVDPFKLYKGLYKNIIIVHLFTNPQIRWVGSVSTSGHLILSTENK